MNPAVSLQRWLLALLSLSIVAYATSESSVAIAAMGVPAAAAAWLLSGGSTPAPLPRAVVNLLLVGVVGWSLLEAATERFGVAAFSQMVVLLLLAKLLDRRTTRDHAQLVFLAVFLSVGAVLTSNSFELGLVLLVFVVVLVVTVLLWQLARVQERAGLALPSGLRRGAVGRLAAAATAFGLVISAAVFLMMPRDIGGQTFGDFSVASVGRQVGFNDSITLGAGGLISESPAVVMDMELRDRSGEPVGAVGERYYLRGAVLDRYDADVGTWSRSQDAIATMEPIASRVGGPEVAIGGASPRQWLLEQRFTIRNAGDTQAHLFAVWRPYRLRLETDVNARYSILDASIRVDSRAGRVDYTVFSNHLEDPPSLWREEHEARLEEWRIGGTPGFMRGFDEGPVAELAREILRGGGLDPDPLTRDPERNGEAVAMLRNHFTAGGYRYTLETIAAPPSRDPVEWFVADGRAGHCEYFASALAFMCRAVGIHARVITGYVAAEYNEALGGYTIRASNAHAWVEAEVLPGFWRVTDPTPAADFDRIHEPARGWLASLRNIRDSIEFAWIRHVVGYDSEAREAVLGSAGAGVHRRVLSAIAGFADRFRASRAGVVVEALSWAMISFCIVAFAGVGVLRGVAIVRALRARPKTPAQARAAGAEAWRASLLRFFEREGVPKPAWSPLGQHAGAVGAGLAPADANAAGRVVESYYRVRFGERDLPGDEAAGLREDLRRLGGNGRAGV